MLSAPKTVPKNGQPAAHCETDCGAQLTGSTTQSAKAGRWARGAESAGQRWPVGRSTGSTGSTGTQLPVTQRAQWQGHVSGGTGEGFGDQIRGGFTPELAGISPQASPGCASRCVRVPIQNRVELR